MHVSYAKQYVARQQRMLERVTANCVSDVHRGDRPGILHNLFLTSFTLQALPSVQRLLVPTAGSHEQVLQEVTEVSKDRTLPVQTQENLSVQ